MECMGVALRLAQGCVAKVIPSQRGMRLWIFIQRNLRGVSDKELLSRNGGLACVDF
jgi:hypothetical protein